MSVTIKKTLSFIDQAFGHLSYYSATIILYVSALIFAFLTKSGVFYLPFDRNFSFNELDYFEILIMIAFLLVDIRFSKRCKAKEMSYWQRLKRYSIISSVAVTLSLSLLGTVILFQILKSEIVYRSDYSSLLDLQYYIFYCLFIFLLYAFSPLPEITWLQKSKNADQDTSEKEKASEDLNSNTEQQPEDAFPNTSRTTTTDFQNKQ